MRSSKEAMGMEGPDYDKLKFKKVVDDDEDGDPEAARANGDFAIHAIHPEHGVVGKLTYADMEHPEWTGYPARALHINMIRVHQDHRRRGVATQLMKHLEETHPDVPIDHGTRTRMGEAWGRNLYGRESKPSTNFMHGMGWDDEANKETPTHYEADWTLNGKPWNVKTKKPLRRNVKKSSINVPHSRAELINHAEGTQTLYKPHGQQMYGHGVCAAHALQLEKERQTKFKDFGVEGMDEDKPEHRWMSVGNGSCGTCTRHQNEAINRLPGGPSAPLDGPRPSPESRPRGLAPRHEPFDPSRFHGLAPSTSSTYTVRLEHGTRRKPGEYHVSDEGPVTPAYLKHPTNVSHVKVHVDPYDKDGNQRPWMEMDQEARNTAAQMTTAPGDMVTKADIIHLEAAFTPDKRVFAGTCGLDHRLFDADGHLKPDVRKYIMSSVQHILFASHDWSKWAIVYFAGSEASEWTSDTLEGNNDFDVLIGVDYQEFRRANPQYAHVSSQAITDLFNQGFRQFNGPVWIPIRTTEDTKGVSSWPHHSNFNPSRYDNSGSAIAQEQLQRHSKMSSGSIYPPYVDTSGYLASRSINPGGKREANPGVRYVASVTQAQSSRAASVNLVCGCTSVPITSRRLLASLSNNTIRCSQHKVGDVLSVADQILSSSSITNTAAALADRVVGSVFEESFVPDVTKHWVILGTNKFIEPQPISGLTRPSEPLPEGWVWTGPWDRTTFCNHDSYDIAKIKPYAAYNVSEDKWAVKPPHLPHWSLSELPRAVQTVLRSASNYAHHVLKLPEPERTQQGAALFDSWHSDRSRAFSDKGEGWWDIANLREKWLDQEGVWSEIVDCKHRANEGLDAAPADWSNTPKFAGRNDDPYQQQRVFWHGTPSGDLRGGSYGLHIGTQEAARQALHARIGFRADGKDWDGTQEYGKTLLAGKDNLRARDPRGYLLTGHNMTAPDHDHYAHERDEVPTFGGEVKDREPMSMSHKPDLFPVRIVGEMSNEPHSAHPDWKANGYMHAQIKRGTARRGYYYKNEGEDSGSISAVVPNGDHLEKLPRNARKQRLEPGRRSPEHDWYTKEAMGQAGPDYEGLHFKFWKNYSSEHDAPHWLDANDKHQRRSFFGMMAFRPGEKQSVGTLEFSPLHYGEGDREVHIHGVKVNPEHQRRGVGTALLKELERHYPDTPINHGLRTQQGADLSEHVYGQPSPKSDNPGHSEQYGDAPYEGGWTLGGKPYKKTANASIDAINEIGKQEHPNVDHYQSGGMGHLEGDESRSVVGFMPVEEMKKYREHAGNWNGEHSEETVRKIREDIRAGKGIHTPLMIEHNPDLGWGYLGEGNHRLRAADEEGLKTVPVRVVRSYGRVEDKKRHGIGAPMKSDTVFNSHDPSYTPSDIHPHHFLKESKIATLVVEHHHWGGGLDSLFPSDEDGPKATAQAPWQAAGQRKDRKSYDENLVARSITHPHEFPTEEVDPRDLRATQPKVIRAGVKHYMENPDAKSDDPRLGNDTPRIYHREDGQKIILSGHHRAAAALLKGEKLRAIVIHGGWGQARNAA